MQRIFTCDVGTELACSVFCYRKGLNKFIRLLYLSLGLIETSILVGACQTLQRHIRAQRRHRSTYVSAQSDLSSLDSLSSQGSKVSSVEQQRLIRLRWCLTYGIDVKSSNSASKDAFRLTVLRCTGWSVLTGRTSFCRFCRAAAHLVLWSVPGLQR